MIEVNCDTVKILFSEDGGGIPEKIILLEPDGNENVIINSGDYCFELELSNGKLLHPCGGECLFRQREGFKVIEFHQVGWREKGGEPIPRLLGSFCHELHDDGTMFTHGFFTAAGTEPPGIKRFELSIRPKFDPNSSLKWGLSYRPEVADGTLIQTAAPERFIDRGVSRTLSTGIMPMVSFQTLDHNVPQVYTEFFVEGGNAVSGKAKDNESSVTWENGNPVIRWNFQKNPCEHHNLPWQWRNHWGMIIKNAPAKRHLPPMVMYHYFDNFEHYPDEKCLKTMAECGCQVLAMHENWRLDIQNGGDPFDEKKFRQLVATAHKYNIRVAPYMRSNENSVEEDSAGWFGNYLQKDFDGLYMDYGGPFHGLTPPDECYQNGRILFRHHYMKLKALRKTIGDDGIFYVHTGPLFSALGLNFIDGYVSGECERGVLLRGRLEHEYFSMSSVATGTLWTAAFPEYGTTAIIPFLAAAGQYPHSTLGIQIASSSLAHPTVPGINDLPYRSLWKIWRTIGGEKDLTIYNDFNCRNKFDSQDPDFIGHYLLESKSKKLLVLANFTPDKQSVTIKTPFFDDDNAVVLNGGNVDSWKGQPLDFSGYGVVGFLVGGSQREIEDYMKPYPPLSKEGEAILQASKNQEQLRKNPPAWKKIAMEVRCPKSAGAPYEESLIYDLWLSEIMLYELDESGEKHKLFELGQVGPERSSVTVDLSLLLSKGMHHLAIQSFYKGQPFYSLVEIRLFDPETPENEYVLEFNNAIDPDRSILSWYTSIV